MKRGFSNSKQLTEREIEHSLNELADIRFALDQATTVAITNAEGIITYVNDKFCEITKYSRDEVIGRTPRIFNSGYHSRLFFEELWKTISSGKIWRGEIKNKAKDGSLFWVDTTIVPFIDQQSKVYQYVSFRIDITAKKQAEEERLLHLRTEFELAKSKDALKARDEFVSMASHDLKTPLASLILMLSLLMKRIQQNGRESLVSEQSVRILENALSQAKRMNAMVSDMLDVVRMSAGKLEIRRERMDLVTLIRDVIMRFEEDFKAAGCDVRIQGEFSVIGDWDLARLEQVIVNLFSNAMKYGAGKPIEVNISRAHSSVRFSVRDYGIGIPQQYHQHIFERFERGAISQNFKGLGLGLWITRQIIAAHGGRIVLESEEKNGARFTIELPL